MNKNRIGTRSQGNLVHTQLEPTKRIKNPKKMAESKTQAFSFIEPLKLVPKYSGEIEIRPFIDTCEIIMSMIDCSQLIFFAKMVALTKLTDRAYNIIEIHLTRLILEKMLLDPLEISYVMANLQIELSLIQMGKNKIANGYNTRVESIFQKLCASITAGKSEDTALTIKDIVKTQAIVSILMG
ncbi:Hypothetical protein CINCED_3A023368 [Cinara cedri]|uniref:Uncharacterized protein n=1 Tax=Cinara cedri TaxID=506608 RepID=A0A5E4MKU8_9HEMI|nr:Hypothetical protein CINCED_3A023368 [Cinara cedri]